jgi:cell division transport system ATP-binding protein
MELLYDINRKVTTVIMATHARELVKNSFKRVIMLEAGTVCSDECQGEVSK